MVINIGGVPRPLPIGGGLREHHNPVCILWVIAGFVPPDMIIVGRGGGVYAC